MTHWRTRAAAGLATTFLLAGCGTAGPRSAALPPAEPSPTAAPSPSPTERTDLLPGMPPPLSVSDIYLAAGPNKLSDAVKGARELVYVPNNHSNDVWVIDPKTFTVIDKFPGGSEPQHVVPSWDLKTLYVAADDPSNGSLIPIDPTTGKPGTKLAIEDPYNLYFTPDGRYGIVVAEEFKRLDFYDPHTWKRTKSLSVPDCAGVNHMDFTVDGRYALASCEFANKMIVIDVAAQTQIRSFALDKSDHGMPQDCRLSPDGKTFYVADMHANGVYTFNADATQQTGFVPTGQGAHAIYFSRDSQRMFVTNRGEGSVTVMDPTTQKIITKWQIPGGGSPDMGSVSADGTQLWLSGRYNNEVYVLSTDDGRLLARIPVGGGPHGLTFWPQPGRYSLGHNNNLR